MFRTGDKKKKNTHTQNILKKNVHGYNTAHLNVSVTHIQQLCLLVENVSYHKKCIKHNQAQYKPTLQSSICLMHYDILKVLHFRCTV